MRLVKLHNRNGECVYVNPAQVVTVEPYPLYAAPEGSTRVERVGEGSKVYFALAGRITTDGPATDSEPYWTVVTEAPTEVAGLFLAPLGRDAA
jgi:hypothetical protein